MHAEPLAGAAAVDRCIHRAGAAPVDILRIVRSSRTRFRRRRSPVIIRSGSSEACCVRVSIVMVSPELISVCGGSERLKIAPMHARGLDRQMMVMPACLGAAATD